MTATRRWPVHPPPLKGEALSSWLARVGSAYRMSTRELIAQEFGVVNATDDQLDLGALNALLGPLSILSRTPSERLKALTVECFPFAEAREFSKHSASSVLLPARIRIVSLPSASTHWVFKGLMRRACPVCLELGPPNSYQLRWRVPIILSCRRHGVMLEDYKAPQWRGRAEAEHRREPQIAVTAISIFDRRTHAALSGAPVELARNTVPGVAWLAMFHRILEEFSLTVLMNHMPARTRTQLGLAESDRPGQYQPIEYQKFENFGQTVQRRRAFAAARVVGAIESGALIARGANPLIPDLIPLQPTAMSPSLAMTLGEAFDAAVHEAFTVGTWGESKGLDLHDIVDASSGFVTPRTAERHLLLERNAIPWPGRGWFEENTPWLD